MAPRTTERLLNLTICLLSATRYISKERIREVVEGYSGQGDQAFERMFERDKEALRVLGVPIDTGSNDPFFEDEVGYRIRRTDFELPPIELDPDEAAAVGVAARAWREASMNESTQNALAKLRAAGVEPDASRLASLQASVAAEPAFATLVAAVQDRHLVKFTYRRDGRETERTLEPWGLTSVKGRWYVIGHDRDRDATRMFKLSRIVGQPRRSSKPGAYTTPDDLDLSALAASLRPPEPSHTAVLAIRRDKAPALRRRSTERAAPELPGGAVLPAGYTVYETGYTETRRTAAEVAEYAADVIVLDPPELRARVVDHLQLARDTLRGTAAPGAGESGDTGGAA